MGKNDKYGLMILVNHGQGQMARLLVVEGDIPCFVPMDILQVYWKACSPAFEDLVCLHEISFSLVQGLSKRPLTVERIDR